MADWILIACLKKLFAEFDEIAPGRDHASDGSIGDTAHQQEVSDHNPDETGSVPIHDADKINEVHAIDVDSDLRTPGLSMEDVVQFLLGRCRSGAETRLRYIIYNRRIWEADNGWKQRAYTGSSAHTEHAHFSASYDSSREASTASWHLEDIDVPLTDDEIDRIAARVWAFKLQDPYAPNDPDRNLPAGTWQKYATSRGQVASSQSAVQSSVAAVGAKVDEVKAAVEALTPDGGDGA